MKGRWRDAKEDGEMQRGRWRWGDTEGSGEVLKTRGDAEKERVLKEMERCYER